MKRLKFIISFSFLLFCNICAISQDNSVDAPIEDTKDNAYDLPDTILFFHQKFVSVDSITVYKNSTDFAYAKNLDSLLMSMQQKQEARRNTKVELPKKDTSGLENFFGSPITALVLWTLAAAFILFILYKLFFSNGIFQKRLVKINVTALPEEEEMSIDGDYTKLIAKAVANKDYRLAVRYLYLQTLQKLSASGAIVFAADKTNYQYVKELASKSYKNNFANVTLHYEYVWYGEFEIDEQIFLQLQSEFKQFHHQL